MKNNVSRSFFENFCNKSYITSSSQLFTTSHMLFHSFSLKNSQTQTFLYYLAWKQRINIHSIFNPNSSVPQIVVKALNFWNIDLQIVSVGDRPYDIGKWVFCWVPMTFSSIMTLIFFFESHLINSRRCCKQLSWTCFYTKITININNKTEHFDEDGSTSHFILKWISRLFTKSLPS